MTMPTNLDDKIKKLSPTQRKKVEARAAQLIAEEMTLRELRHARKLTQVRIAKTLGITQDSVSRLEKRGDLMLSTLRKTVQAMGGNLSLVAEFPDRAPVVLSGIAGDDMEPKPASRKGALSHATAH
jgi:DNA-binding XRE family transcriptional regulator